MSREMGATLPWCGFNVHVAKGMLVEAAAKAYAAVGEVIPSDVPGLTALGVRQPVGGVVVGIAPWNAPLILGVRSIVWPLVWGNAVVLKSSEQTPLTQAAIVQVLHDAGVPAGAVNLISNAPEDGPSVVEALIAHRAVTRVNFTGSSRVGRIIGELGGRHLTRVVLELGGKAFPGAPRSRPGGGRRRGRFRCLHEPGRAAAFSPAWGAAWPADARETEAPQRLDRELEEFFRSV
ncbi:aldehyde dehydrogenase family protein [Streptomyces canus]|uniref:aldehyde dehydrogenase family protein n=1 Tax=Streptomyces canus TaxID=58343 RepID=UPI00341135C8